MNKFDQTWPFINNPEKYPRNTIAEVFNFLNSPIITLLETSYGFDPVILNLIVIQIVLSKDKNTQPYVSRETFMYKLTEINKERLINSRFFQQIQDHSTSILSLPWRLNNILVTHAQESLKCQKCTVNSSSILFLPCGHIILCNSCSRNMSKCIQCKTNIKETHQIYL